MANTSTIKSEITSRVMEAGGTAAVIGFGFKTFSGVSSYNQSRRDGDGFGKAVAKGASSAFLADMIGPKTLMTAKFLKNAPGQATRAFYTMDQQRRQMGMAGRNQPFQNAQFFDTEQAFTMRQAGLKMAQQSQFSRQQAMMGNEAQYIG